MLAGVILALVTWASGTPARAATVPTGFQEYHVIGQKQHVWDMFNRPVIGQPFVGFTLSNAMLSVVSATASSANQIVYYDHWEDNADVTGDGIPDFEQDIVNVLGYGDSVVPTLLTPIPQGLFPSDNLYADVVGNDWLPEMAIGRLPVIDAAELVAVTAKIAAYEQSRGDWQRRVVVAADRPDLGGDFPTDSDQVADLMPGSYAIERIHLDELLPNDARSRMLSAFASGRAFVNFFGHSGFMSLGNTDLINVSDVPGLGNGERLPVVTAFTCLAGQFGFPGQESIAETLVISSDGGAAAMWSPSGLSVNNRAKLLGEGFYASTFEKGERVIGEAILEA